MDDPREMLADCLRGLADTLRHHRDLGLQEITLSRNPFPAPDDALREQERALAWVHAVQALPEPHHHRLRLGQRPRAPHGGR